MKADQFVQLNECHGMSEFYTILRTGCAPKGLRELRNPDTLLHHQSSRCWLVETRHADTIILSTKVDSFLDKNTEINRIRKEQRLGVFPTILSLVSKLPGSLRHYCFHKYASKGDLLISLIPSGRKRRHLDHSEVTAIYAQPAIPPGHAIAIGIVIYADQIAISLQYDPNLITEIEHLVRRIKESIGRWIGDLTKSDGVAPNYSSTC